MAGSEQPPSYTETPLEAACHCKAVVLSLPHPPKYLNACECTICYSYGVMWAYYPRNEVLVTVEAGTHTEKYVWGDKMLEFHRCSKCGCVTHWWETPEHDTGSTSEMGVNGRLLGKETIAGIEVRCENPE